MKRREFLKMSIAGGTVALFDAQSFAAALAADGRAKTLVVGGGAFALGYALAHREDALVLERGIHLAADFACTCGPQKLGTPKTSLGRELRDGPASCGILNGEHLELPPLADYMGAFFADHGGRAFMNAEPAEIEKVVHGYRLAIYGGGANGLSSFTVGNVLDATDVGFGNVGEEALAGKRFGGIGPDGPFSVDLPPDADWHAARLCLYDAWEKAGHRPDELLAEANALRCIYRTGRISRRVKDGWRWVPSAQFTTLMEAFEEGLAWKSV